MYSPFSKSDTANNIKMVSSKSVIVAITAAGFVSANANANPGPLPTEPAQYPGYTPHMPKWASNVAPEKLSSLQADMHSLGESIKGNKLYTSMTAVMATAVPQSFKDAIMTNPESVHSRYKTDKPDWYIPTHIFSLIQNANLRIGTKPSQPTSKTSWKTTERKQRASSPTTSAPSQQEQTITKKVPRKPPPPPPQQRASIPPKQIRYESSVLVALHSSVLSVSLLLYCRQYRIRLELSLPYHDAKIPSLSFSCRCI